MVSLMVWFLSLRLLDGIYRTRASASRAFCRQFDSANTGTRPAPAQATTRCAERGIAPRSCAPRGPTVHAVARLIGACLAIPHDARNDGPRRPLSGAVRHDDQRGFHLAAARNAADGDGLVGSRGRLDS